MTPEWIPLLLIAGFLGFRLVLHASYPLCIFLHELGHALPARLLGKTSVEVHIGANAPVLSGTLFGIEITLHREHTHTGTTHYQGEVQSVLQACLIILTAPLLSLTLTVALTAWLLGMLVYQSLPLTFIASALTLANLHITLSAWLPLGNAHSDWLDFVKTMQKLRQNPRMPR
ncbi:MAG: hypothetical protein ABQ298_03310 [Puniceicoccaceae bacterium]